MKSFKKIFSEVAQPNNPEERKFKDQHVIQKIDHPVAEPSQFTGEIQGKKRVKRLADYIDGEDEKAYDLATQEESVEINEKSVSKSQQKLMGMALAYKRGEMDDDEVSDEVKDLAKSMSEKDLEDFAKTKHKGLPNKVDEAVESLLENPQEEIPMMRQQLAFIVYAAKEIDDYLQMVDDPEEWYQNKLAYAFAQIKSLHAYAEGDKAMMSRYDDDDDDEDDDYGNYGGYGGSYNSYGYSYESVVSESIKQGKLKLKDGSTVMLSKEDADALEEVLGTMSTKNRKQMESDLMKDKKSFTDTVKFAREAQ
jgi:hypothetical protein